MLDGGKPCWMEEKWENGEDMIKVGKDEMSFYIALQKLLNEPLPSTRASKLIAIPLRPYNNLKLTNLRICFM